MLPPLYPHQARGIAQLRGVVASGVSRIVFVLPCGGGKTRTAVEVVARGLNRGNRTLWLAHREELLDQAAKDIREAGVDCGIVKADRDRRDTAPVQVCSEQTLRARPQSLPEGIDFIVEDECHHSACETRQAILARYPNAKLVLGLTATPQRADGRGLGEASGGIYQALVVGATVPELQRTPRDLSDPDGPKILVPIHVVGPGPKHDQRALFRSPVEGLLEFGRRPDGSMRPALMFARDVEESRKIAIEAHRQGIRAAHIDADTDPFERHFAFVAMRSGELDLITNVGIATEGTDLPNVEVVGVARGCSAESTLIQMVMRGARSSPGTGKRDMLFIDYRGLTWTHGLMDRERTYTLDGKGIEPSRGEQIQQCKACGAVFRPQPECPRCGAKNPPMPPQRVKRSEAVRITEAMMGPWKEKREYFDRLCAEQKAKSHKVGWIYAKFRGVYGIAPPWGVPGAEVRR